MGGADVTVALSDSDVSGVDDLDCGGLMSSEVRRSAAGGASSASGSSALARGDFRCCCASGAPALNRPFTCALGVRGEPALTAAGASAAPLTVTGAAGGDAAAALEDSERTDVTLRTGAAATLEESALTPHYALTQQ